MGRPDADSRCRFPPGSRDKTAGRGPYGHRVSWRSRTANACHADAVFSNRDGYRALYPDAAPIAATDRPTVKSTRQLPASMRRMLEARALAIGAAPRRVAAVA